MSGELPSCEFVKLAVQRFLDDLQRKDLFFDEKETVKVVNFFLQLKHYKGEKAGEFIDLEDWQIFVLANIFGLKRKKTGFRKYNYADVFLPRKNGKTTFAAGIGDYMMLMDKESGAEVYAAAVDKEQAKICFEAGKELVKGTIFEQVVQAYRSALVYQPTASAFKPLSKDTKNKDGLNPHCAICDERHAWKTNEIYDVIKTGMGARRQPLIFSISTAGTDTSLPYFADIEALKDVLRGIKQKDNHFIMLYCPDQGDRYDDPATWAKVNPNLGVSLSLTYMENECAEAKMRGGSFMAAFCTKNLNMWVDAPDVWINDDIVHECNAPFDESQLLGKKCYVGIDLASKKDITATAFWFPDFNVFKYLFYVPEDKIKEVEDRVDYRLWAQQGWITPTPGSVLDEDWFIDHLLKELDKYNIQCIAYDPWGMWNILPKFGRYRGRLEEYKQSIGNMSVPTKDLETRILQRRINFLNNPVIRWMIKNVTIYRDANDNIKLDKARSRNKIDGVVASVDALGGWFAKTAGQTTKQLYTGHTLRTVKMP